MPAGAEPSSSGRHPAARSCGAPGFFGAHGPALRDLRHGLLPFAFGRHAARSSAAEGFPVSTPNPTESDVSRLQDAGEWVQRLNESNDQGLADQWMEWCRSDPRNLAQFEQMQSIWEGFAAAKDAPAALHQPATPVARRNRLIALAASVVLLVGAAGWFALRYIQFQVFDTAVGEQRRIALADGSQLDLAPDSRVSTRFTWARRGVQLERGQAFFAVAHDPMRPFVVHVTGLTVTAVGTAFDVRTGPSNTVVTVSEGRVNIA